ncbi:hypothetical protein CQW23_21697 [Capsicum baccatum]|uniref:Pentatricopeptide repeat-containing protein n=1 Tax=Capsicum baccatum TaxID=33114 RepID=A0A2G2VYQ4_CAPBA|nr:hypothetical protein CQW23_21697 [Capsicum baccatum]
MLKDGFLPKSSAFSPLMSACAKTGCLGLGQKCHGQVHEGMDERDVVSWNSIVNGYVNVYEENIGVEVPSEETNMDETGQIVPYIIVENSRNPYIDRWTRNATKEKAIDHPSEITNVKPSTLWFNNIIMHSMGLAEQATRSEKYYLFAHQRLLQLCRELDELPYESEEDCISNDQVGEKDCEMNQVGEKDCEMNGCEQSQDVTLFDPPVVETKGRLESLRKKYALEVAQKAKKGRLKKIEDKNVVSWNVMVAGYFHNALPDKAVCLFRHMVSCRFQPDEISVTSALWACSTLSAVRLGKEIHCFALKTNLIED